MKNILKKSFGITAALLLTSSMAAHAGTATQNITLTGTITPPPASCTFGAPATVAFNGRVDNYDYMQPFSVAVTCTNGTAYSLNTPLSTGPNDAMHPILVGSETAYISLARGDSGNSLRGHPATGIGTGVAQTISLYAVLEAGPDQNLDPTRHIGQVSGFVPMTLSY